MQAGIVKAGRHPLLNAICCPGRVGVGKLSPLLLLGRFSKDSGICKSRWFLFHTRLVIAGVKANSPIAAQTTHPSWEATAAV